VGHRLVTTLLPARKDYLLRATGLVVSEARPLRYQLVPAPAVARRSVLAAGDTNFDGPRAGVGEQVDPVVDDRALLAEPASLLQSAGCGRAQVARRTAQLDRRVRIDVARILRARGTECSGASEELGFGGSGIVSRADPADALPAQDVIGGRGAGVALRAQHGYRGFVVSVDRLGGQLRALSSGGIKASLGGGFGIATRADDADLPALLDFTGHGAAQVALGTAHGYAGLGVLVERGLETLSTLGLDRAEEGPLGTLLVVAGTDLAKAHPAKQRRGQHAGVVAESAAQFNGGAGVDVGRVLDKGTTEVKDPSAEPLEGRSRAVR